MAMAFRDTLAPYRSHDWERRSAALQADTIYRQARVRSLEVFDYQPIDQNPKVDPAIEGTVKAEFRAKFEQWLNDSLFDSLPDMMKDHASYQAIVGLGDRAIPFIAAELGKEPSFIFLALEDITGADPVRDDALGDLQATTDAWLAWLRS